MADAHPPLNVLFLWHQHQPFYKDLLSHRYELPWVRLHATKDYYDMVALLDEFPKMRANFNLVPSLLAQLDDYATHKAQDRFLSVTLKKVADLSFEDKQFLLKNFFKPLQFFIINLLIHYNNCVVYIAAFNQIVIQQHFQFM